MAGFDEHARKQLHLTNKDDVTKYLAKCHFEIAPDTVEILRIKGDNEESPTEPIKLIEVNDDTFPTDKVEPFYFGPVIDIPYSTQTAIVTGAEMDKIRNGEIALPSGWKLDGADILKPEDVE